MKTILEAITEESGFEEAFTSAVRRPSMKTFVGEERTNSKQFDEFKTNLL
jgi:hypothetical protein